MNSSNNYYNKYLKYKSKYLNQKGGEISPEVLQKLYTLLKSDDNSLENKDEFFRLIKDNDISNDELINLKFKNENSTILRLAISQEKFDIIEQLINIEPRLNSDSLMVLFLNTLQHINRDYHIPRVLRFFKKITDSYNPTEIESLILNIIERLRNSKCHIHHASKSNIRLLNLLNILFEHPIMNGSTPLHYVVRKDDIILTEFLLHNVDPNIRDTDGNTPLHIAVITENIPIIKLLIRKGADITIQNNNIGNNGYGETSYDFATPEMKNSISAFINYTKKRSDEVDKGTQYMPKSISDIISDYNQ
jgi:ankyrin repeat protein